MKYHVFICPVNILGPLSGDASVRAYKANIENVQQLSHADNILFVYATHAPSISCIPLARHIVNMKKLFAFHFRKQSKVLINPISMQWYIKDIANCANTRGAN